jgi:hypothetical protein
MSQGVEILAGQPRLALGRQLPEILRPTVLPRYDGQGMSPLGTVPVPVVPIVTALAERAVPLYTTCVDSNGAAAAVAALLLSGLI